MHDMLQGGDIYIVAESHFHFLFTWFNVSMHISQILDFTPCVHISKFGHRITLNKSDIPNFGDRDSTFKVPAILKGQSFSGEGGRYRDGTRLWLCDHLPVNAVCNFATPLYLKVLQLCHICPGTALTHLWYNPVSCFELHTTYIGIGFDMWILLKWVGKVWKSLWVYTYSR